MTRFVYVAPDESATELLGRKLAELLPDGTVIALVGPLGAGKTRLVQAVAEASGIDRRSVASPTFVLVHEYRGRRPIFHFDAYRVKDEDEFLALAPFEYFDAGGLCFVEWADRVESCLPRDFLQIEIEPIGDRTRRFSISARGDKLGRIVDALTAWQPEAP
jgi:tRNA threonylcarbamoyladenosine biosynthesis protein TsaE